MYICSDKSGEEKVDQVRPWVREDVTTSVMLYFGTGLVLMAASLDTIR